jgi:hypothetical protein
MILITIKVQDLGCKTRFKTLLKWVQMRSNESTSLFYMRIASPFGPQNNFLMQMSF